MADNMVAMQFLRPASRACSVGFATRSPRISVSTRSDLCSTPSSRIASLDENFAFLDSNLLISGERC